MTALTAVQHHTMTEIKDFGQFKAAPTEPVPVQGGVEKYLRARTNVLEMLRKLPDIAGQRFSWNSLVDLFTGIVESVDTIQKYFEYLGYSFILMNVFLSTSRERIRGSKSRRKVIRAIR